MSLTLPLKGVPTNERSSDRTQGKGVSTPPNELFDMSETIVKDWSPVGQLASGGSKAEHACCLSTLTGMLGPGGFGRLGFEVTGCVNVARTVSDEGQVTTPGLPWVMLRSSSASFSTLKMDPPLSALVGTVALSPYFVNFAVKTTFIAGVQLN